MNWVFQIDSERFQTQKVGVTKDYLPFLIPSIMKKIIVPIDYSESSHNSITVAQQLCELWDAQLEVIFCWRPHLEMEMVSTGMIGKESVHRERLYGFLEKHQLDETSGKLLIGLPGDIITKVSGREDTSMIIMGTVKEYGLIEKIMGSVASHVVNNAQCPVLLVPPNVTFQGRFKKILVAGELESTDEKSFQQIIDYTKQFNAVVEFTNVSSFEEEGTGLHISDELVEKITRQEDIGFSFSVVNIYNASIEQGLNNHCRHNQIDLMVFVTRKHRWWESLLNNKTLIDPEKIAIEMHRPILVFRIDE